MSTSRTRSYDHHEFNDETTVCQNSLWLATRMWSSKIHAPELCVGISMKYLSAT